MAQGTVKWFNHKNGYGFIEREGDSDLFVHITNIEGKIVDGDSVEFEVGESDKAPWQQCSQSLVHRHARRRVITTPIPTTHHRCDVASSQLCPWWQRPFLLNPWSPIQWPRVFHAIGHESKSESPSSIVSHARWIPAAMQSAPFIRNGIAP